MKPKRQCREERAVDKQDTFGIRLTHKESRSIVTAYRKRPGRQQQGLPPHPPPVWEAQRQEAFRYGELAQLARAPALHAGGQRFESVILHRTKVIDMMEEQN